MVLLFLLVSEAPGPEIQILQEISSPKLAGNRRKTKFQQGSTKTVFLFCFCFVFCFVFVGFGGPGGGFGAPGGGFFSTGSSSALRYFYLY